MSRVSVTVPAETPRASQAGDLHISELTGKALTAELDRRATLVALDEYLRKLTRVGRGRIGASRGTR